MMLWSWKSKEACFSEGQTHSNREELANPDLGGGGQNQGHSELGTFGDVKLGGQKGADLDLGIRIGGKLGSGSNLTANTRDDKSRNVATFEAVSLITKNVNLDPTEEAQTSFGDTLKQGGSNN